MNRTLPRPRSSPVLDGPDRAPSRAMLYPAGFQPLTLHLSAKELAARRKTWRPPKPRYARGVLAKYAHTVTFASLGAVTDAKLKP